MHFQTFQKIYFCVLFLFLILKTGYTQVERVNLDLQYNEKTGLFDCYLMIEKGHSTTHRDRIQCNAQISFTVRTGSKTSVAKLYFPLIDNRFYEGKDAMMWYIGDKIISPPAMPGYDVFNVLPMLSPTSWYHDLKEGDKIKLFSLLVENQQNSELALFKNENYTKENESGFNGGDFRIGFTIGGIEQKYRK
jgi:hypothetical protein